MRCIMRTILVIFSLCGVRLWTSRMPCVGSTLGSACSMIHFQDAFQANSFGALYRRSTFNALSYQDTPFLCVGIFELMFGRVHEYVMWSVNDILNVPVNVRHFYAIFPSCTRGSFSNGMVVKQIANRTMRVAGSNGMQR